MQRLSQKVAVITGGNSGIGKGIAKQFHDEGAKVVIFGRTQETLDEAVKEIGADVLAVQGDVTETADLEKLYETTLTHFGKIDIVVANSGVGERLHVADAHEDHFNYLVNTNYRGVYFTVKRALPYLNDGAAIILIASTAAHVTLKHHSVYASTKAAVLKLAKNFANDLASRQIRVNSISPGYIHTRIFDKRLEKDPAYLSKRAARIPLQRVGTPSDIGRAAVFLASDDASYITGADLLVDGGYASSFHEPE